MTPTPEEIEQQYRKSGWGSPLAVPAAVFTIYSFLCFFQCCGFGSAMDATTALSFGIIQVILFIGFFTGALVLIKRGEQAAGQIYMIFAIAFGGVGGVLAFLTFGVTGLVAIPVLFVLGVQSMITYDGFMFGVVNLTIGLYLVAMAPCYIHGDLLTLDTNIAPTIGLLLFGITGMGLCPADMVAPLIYAAGVAFLFCGIGGFIVVANALNAGVATIPGGPVLFPARNK